MGLHFVQESSGVQADGKPVRVKKKRKPEAFKRMNDESLRMFPLVGTEYQCIVWEHQAKDPLPERLRPGEPWTSSRS